MLNYLGPSIGPSGPITNQLPPAVTGTMPQGVPRVPPIPAPLPPMPHGHPAAASHNPHIMPRPQGGGLPPALLAAILSHAPGQGGMDSPAPKPPQQYAVTTQSDGTLLLHLKNPDGSPGTIVKVLPAPKQPNPSQPGM